MIIIDDSVQRYNLKNKAFSNIKIYQILCSIVLNNVGIYLRDGPFEPVKAIVNLYKSKGTHWVAYIKENYFDSYGCVCLKKLSRYIIQRNGYCIYSKNKIQGLTSERDSDCASYCLYLICLTKVIGIDFKSDVLNLYYQTI